MKDIKITKLKSDLILHEELQGVPMTFHTTWGLFSPRAIDEGSKMLINELKINPTDTILDLGCGYGAIGLTAAKRAPQGTTHLIDKDFIAIEYVKKNAQANNITNYKTYLSNAFSAVPNIQFDIIVSNLPAKVGDEMITIILNDAKAHLKSGGKLYVVTISGLREYIKRNFKETFGNYQKVSQAKTYTVACATKE